MTGNGRVVGTELRVRYSETDRMGIAWHGYFLSWFEVGRTDLLREAGSTYRDLESDGWFLPVVELSCTYRNPARYDDRLLVEVKCVDGFANEHLAQCINYLKVSGLHLALLINFRRPKVEWRRVVHNL